MIYYLLCRKAETASPIESSADIYTIEGKQYIGYTLAEKQEPIFEALKKANLKVFRVVELNFPDPKDSSSKAKFTFIRWVFICDS
ncbi:MAG: hypothetical protein NTX00_01750 [Candidatus Parcubacteria bacterium]|nr:hypothetical protein [Candidatus Parcubacteria bacterium]